MITLGSLFDGAGGFPFAAQICGIEPVWASEIEPFPIAVTSKRFPNMKHLGDITKINGAEIEPVDIITFGSPCQDLSVAGNQKGLSGERSGLFMEAIRIINEMREKTNGRYPRYAVWENVPGAFSSNKGDDFRTVLEELVKVKDGSASIPRPPKGKWSDAGQIVGDWYSVAWRVLDAQFWGVPQRRRRIFLVADFRGGGAGKILFERAGLSRNFAESRETWKGITKSLAFSAGDQSKCYCLQGNGIDRADTAGCNGRGWREDASYTLNTIDRPAVVYSVENHSADSRVTVSDDGKVQTLTSRMGTGGNNVPLTLIRMATQQGGAEIANNLSPTITGDHNNRVTDYTAVCCYSYQRSGEYKQNDTASTETERQYKEATDLVCYPINTMVATRGGQDDMRTCFGIGENGDPQFTISAAHGHGVCYKAEDFVLRRLTPTECARLQGMPDWWCDDVPHSDSAEYKMWGNGMALPCVLYVMEGIATAMAEKWVKE